MDERLSTKEVLGDGGLVEERRKNTGRGGVRGGMRGSGGMGIVRGGKVGEEVYLQRKMSVGFMGLGGGVRGRHQG